MTEPDLNQLPAAFLKRLELLLDPPARAAWQRAAARLPMSVRWTGPPGQESRGADYLKEHGFDPHPIGWAPDAWTLPGAARRSVTGLDWVRSQQLFVQSASSMAAVQALGVQPGHDVLDLCAAPGAKTSLIHRRQEGRGILVANELSRARSRRLHALLSRLDITGVEILVGGGEHLGRSHARCFDRVLADVPCSGEGRFHLSDQATWSNWSESSIRGLSRRQTALLQSACHACRPGGEVLYATCTMAPEENEQVIDRVLSKADPHVELLPVDMDIPGRRPGLQSWGGVEFSNDLSHAVRIQANEIMTPFFMARLRKVGSV
ncbi:MAG: RsmB/NOP family class I SAM-dependent RNA methyltransferase [Phycisphaerales bacterium]|nr:RsmB/NOP family class I SAM-dependent RNA methyltransferase [Phycisphaerales bacterium]